MVHLYRGMRRLSSRFLYRLSTMVTPFWGPGYSDKINEDCSVLIRPFELCEGVTYDRSCCARVAQPLALYVASLVPGECIFIPNPSSPSWFLLCRRCDSRLLY